MSNWKDILAGNVSNGIFIFINAFFTLIIGLIGYDRIYLGKNFGKAALVFFVLSIISLIVLLYFTIDDYDNDEHIYPIIVTKIIITILICTYILYPTIYKYLIYKTPQYWDLPAESVSDSLIRSNSVSKRYLSGNSISENYVEVYDTDNLDKNSRSNSWSWVNNPNEEKTSDYFDR